MLSTVLDIHDTPAVTDICPSPDIYRRTEAIVNPSVCLSVRLSVRQTLALVLCQNDSSYDHGVFTVG